MSKPIDKNSEELNKIISELDPKSLSSFNQIAGITATQKPNYKDDFASDVDLAMEIKRANIEEKTAGVEITSKIKMKNKI